MSGPDLAALASGISLASILAPVLIMLAVRVAVDRPLDEESLALELGCGDAAGVTVAAAPCVLDRAWSVAGAGGGPARWVLAVLSEGSGTVERRTRSRTTECARTPRYAPRLGIANPPGTMKLRAPRGTPRRREDYDAGHRSLPALRRPEAAIRLGGLSAAPVDRVGQMT